MASAPTFRRDVALDDYPDDPAPVRALVVGGGWMGHLHAECLQELAGVEVVGVVDPSPTSTAEFTAAVPVPAFPDVTAAIGYTEADLVSICSPSGLHAEHAEAALAWGRHVVIEKPVATTVHDAERIRDAAVRSSGTASVILQYRFHRDALILRRAVENGHLGTILLAVVENHLNRDDAYFAVNGGWRATWALNGGGILINQTTHGMDLLDWCLGPVTDVAAHGGALAHSIEVEDTVTATLRFAGGGLGVVAATSAAEANRPLRLEITGSAGSVLFERARIARWDVPIAPASLLTDDELAVLPPSPSEAYGEPFGQAHRRQYAAIVAAIRAGRAPAVSVDEAIGSLRTIEQIYTAAGLGQQ